MIRFFPLFLLCFSTVLFSQNSDRPDWEGGRPDGCTSITVGRAASDGGWVSTSHTCDSHRTRSWFDIQPAQNYKEGDMLQLVMRTNDDSLAMPAYKHIPTGNIPQVRKTYGYINTAYPCMNDQQLAVGESTFGGRESLLSKEGKIDCQMLNRLMIERCATAREAIELARVLLAEYGWNDAGECLTIADTKEVWHFEVVGPGAGNVGAIWAAQRVPDDHISVNANASRIRQVDMDNPDYFLCSDNLTQVAQDSGWWSPGNGPFEFCYAYDPEGRQSMAARRREWRVFDLLAPSLKLHPNAENYPFSVKPDSLVRLADLVAVFRDYFENTDFNFVKNITVTDDSGRTVLSPLANPFMPYDMNKVFKINGGWGWRGERTIARWYTMYATITQSRDHLPNEVGGLVWMAMDNVANSIYVPLYCSVVDVAPPYKTPGRVYGFNRDSAWWAFNRLGTVAAQRWGDMRHDLAAIWYPWQDELFARQKTVEEQALKLLQQDAQKARAYLTDYGIEWGNKVVQKAWELGDGLWTKYDEKF
ncbi:peptidase C69 [candidate division KSB1 bacterium]|nr:C69 family dipeptidase [candidate division KSB1 bacterium]RQW05762.1 MAG: peptidase C69 [candidate division KSB1 bacterium]